MWKMSWTVFCGRTETSDFYPYFSVNEISDMTTNGNLNYFCKQLTFFFWETKDV